MQPITIRAEPEHWHGTGADFGKLKGDVIETPDGVKVARKVKARDRCKTPPEAYMHLKYNLTEWRGYPGASWCIYRVDYADGVVTTWIRYRRMSPL